MVADAVIANAPDWWLKMGTLSAAQPAGIEGDNHRKTRVYLIGALKNSDIPDIANRLEREGYKVFADWFSPGPSADQYWQDYESHRGRSHRESMNGPHVWNVFNYDKHWLDWCDVAVLVMPAGKSGHLELGYCVGMGKRTAILFNGEPERFDVMHRFARDIVYSTEELIEVLNAV